MGALVTGAAVVTGAVLGTVGAAGATVVVLGPAVVELGTAGIRQSCQKPFDEKIVLVGRKQKLATTVAWGQGTYLMWSSLEDVFYLRWHPAQQ